ncbi:MAG TPA: hypothetical protein VFC19_33595, partial [Candidatus Limnocylindrales bacterium]|nr:hypothetical protein [Candidatus Limnocylindrales bacterium]
RPCPRSNPARAFRPCPRLPPRHGPAGALTPRPWLRPHPEARACVIAAADTVMNLPSAQLLADQFPGSQAHPRGTC